VADVRAALVDALGVVRRLGGAEVGDRTLVDALAPFVDAFPTTAPSLVQAWSEALPPMRAAADGTARLVPRKGRAATHGAKALGTVDAGARSLAIALDAAGEALRELDAGTGGEA
jgi:dihydroxyacetone kinase